MKTVCKEDMCTGCMACVDICTKGAISIQDDLMTYNAVLDKSKCINCGMCTKVCPNNETLKLTKPVKWYQGWALEDAIRQNSSSGGIAAAIQKSFIEDGGVVCSCVFECGKFLFKVVDTVKQIEKFKGSKYLKSNPTGAYKEVKRQLNEGHKVLFTGLPCQVAAMKRYIGKCNESQLFTIDLICHGTPSPEILNHFLEEYGFNLNRLDNIKFRTKTKSYVSQHEAAVMTPGICDYYSIAFLNSICYTNNCYNCKYACIERISDITIGDSWGSELSKTEQKKGISLILCQNSRGMQLLKNADLNLERVSLDKAILANQQLEKPTEKPNKRMYFFQSIKKGKKFSEIIWHCYPWICFKQKIKTLLVKCKIIKGGVYFISLYKNNEK